jgi:hypothetical protein
MDMPHATDTSALVGRVERCANLSHHAVEDALRLIHTGDLDHARIRLLDAIVTLELLGSFIDDADDRDD